MNYSIFTHVSVRVLYTNCTILYDNGKEKTNLFIFFNIVFMYV